MISYLVSTECLLVWEELEPQSRLSWLQKHINNNHYQGWWWREHGLALYECPDLVREGERMPLWLQCYWQLTLDLSISVIKEAKIAQWLLTERGGRGGKGRVL